MKKSVESRSAMNITLMTRLLGMIVTLFILILTVKSELLEYNAITLQLVLSIPLLFGALVINSKITDEGDLKKYRIFNIFINSCPIALVSNVIGLLIMKNVSVTIGLYYFIAFIGIYSYLFVKDWKKMKIYNEIIVLLISIFFGLVPTLINLL